MASKQDPLKFAYVKVLWTGADFETKETYKIFHVDPVKIRIRSIVVVDGKEVEGDNLWAPWSSIDALREVGNA